MTDEMRDDAVIQAAVAELRKTEAVDATVIARVVHAAVDARDDDVRVSRDGGGIGRRTRIAAVALLTAAAGVAGFMLRGASTRPGAPAVNAPASVAAAAPNAPTQLQPVSASDLDAMAVPTQFVFENRGAHHVALVGDFNGWSPSATPMARSNGSSLWAITIPVPPGRHLYAFMVDDSVFTLDPRKPAATDKDIGARASVVIVGRP